MNQLDVRQLANVPPRTDIFPNWPIRETISREPIHVEFAHIIYATYDPWPYQPDRIAENLKISIGRVDVMVKHAPGCIAPIAPDENILSLW